MTKYRKKPVVIDACQWDGTAAGWAAIVHELDAHDKIELVTDGDLEGPPIELSIETTEGVMSASKFDWIIKGVMGELYPCKPDIFALTYGPEHAVDAAQLEDDVLTIDEFRRWRQSLPVAWYGQPLLTKIEKLIDRLRGKTS